MDKQKRFSYIDNIRWITIMLLIPFHAGMAYSSWESNYIHFGDNRAIGSFVQLVWPFFIPILFVAAGVSARTSIAQCGYKKYLLERVNKLLLPLVIGTISIVPIMTYIANITNSNFDGMFYDHCEYFFTHFTDGTGYDGAFTVGHLWFLLYLFVVSVIALIVIYAVVKILNQDIERDVYELAVLELGEEEDAYFTAKYQYILVGTFFIIPFLFRDILSICGKGLMCYFSYFLIGYYLFSKDKAVKKIASYRHIFMLLYVVCAVVDVYMFLYMKNANSFVNSLFMYAAGWFGCLGILGIARARLNRTNKLTKWLSRNSFLFYLMHFPVLICVQYYVGQKYEGLAYRFWLAILISYVITFLLTFLFSLFNNIASRITAARIVCSIYMVLLEPFSLWFWIIYFVAGLSDFADGFLARRLKLASEKGARLDSFADLFFAGAIIYTLVTTVEIPRYVWKMCLIVIAIKAFTALVGLIFHKKIIFLHTILNKITGVMLFMFLVVFQLFRIKTITIVIGVVAIISAIEECLIVARQNEVSFDEKGYIARTSLYYNVISSGENENNKNKENT